MDICSFPTRYFLRIVYCLCIMVRFNGIRLAASKPPRKWDSKHSLLALMWCWDGCPWNYMDEPQVAKVWCRYRIIIILRVSHCSQVRKYASWKNIRKEFVVNEIRCIELNELKLPSSYRYRKEKSSHHYKILLSYEVNPKTGACDGDVRQVCAL